MFIGREVELRTLESLYMKDAFQMVVIYGRRRVGKTTLISKFTEGKPTVFFSAQEANDKMNLTLFSKAVFTFFKVSSTLPSFQTWDDALAFIAEKAKIERFILAIDEFPYAVDSNRSLKSIMQNIIDHQFKDTNIFIILCGSQISFMENEVLGYKSPLFGRRTSQMKIHGFNYLDASKMLETFGLEDKIKFYACIGGTPHYLAQVDSEKGFEDNLLNLYFNTAGYLFDEPIMLLKQELREPAMYNSIISAIALGATRLNEISTKIGEERFKTIKYLETLINLRIVHKEYPFGDNPAKSRKGIYKISDNCFRFWYRYVFAERAAIEQGAGKAVLKSILPEINGYIGMPFEDVCLQYMINKNNNSELPFIFTRSGRWWGNNPYTKSQEEIDLVFSDSNCENMIFAECKWRNEVKDVSLVKRLIEKSELFKGCENKYYYIFSKADFSRECVDLAGKMGNLQLVATDALFANG